MEDKRTIAEWSEEYGVTVLDPDGFDRTDESLYEKLFSREEFKNGLFFSTIILNGNALQRLQDEENMS